MTLRVARIVRSVLSTLLAVLEAAGLGRAVAILAARRTELVLSAVLALLLRIALVVAAVTLLLAILGLLAIALLGILVVWIRHCVKYCDRSVDGEFGVNVDSDS